MNSDEMVLLNPLTIKVPPRRRSNTDREPFDQLKKSIEEFGQLQPIGVTPDLTLIWGYNRLCACRNLGLPVKAIITNITDETTRVELEIFENLHRSDFSYKDECKAKAELHDIWMNRYANNEWSIRKSASRIGISKTLLAIDLKVAAFLRVRPDLFKSYEKRTDVRRRIKQLEQKIIIDQAHKRTQAHLAEEPPEPTEEELQRAKENLDARESRHAEMEQARTKGLLLRYNRDLITGNFFDHHHEIQDGTVDIALLDPMWGTNTQELRVGKRSSHDYDDSTTKCLEEFRVLCQLVYNKMSPNSHLYCFFAIRFHYAVYGALDDAGFATNGIPITIIKEDKTPAQNPGIWPPNSCEFVAFARKGNREIIQKGAPNFIKLKWIKTSDKLGHPFAKPPEVYQELLARSAHPKDYILDPMFGTGAAFVACERMGMNLCWTGYDLEEENKKIALMKLIEEIEKGD